MAKNTDASCRQCRAEGTKLFLKGDRCLSKKCAMERRPVAPGQHGAGRKKTTEYKAQLREKQKVKRAYGVLEKQFKNYYFEAERMKGITGENMLSLLERRLDNVVYRLGLGDSRSQSRQIVNHGHICVNGSRVDIPSYLVKAGDKISVKENKQKLEMFKDIKNSKVILPKWLEIDTSKLEGSVTRLPSREDIDLTIQEHLIVELYSR